MPGGLEIAIVLMLAIGAMILKSRRALKRLGIASNTCANCGYNLTALSSQRCPECGTTIEVPLRRVRRVRMANSVLRMAITLLVGIVVWFGLGILQEFGPFYHDAEFTGQLSTDIGRGRAIQVVGHSTWWGNRESGYIAREPDTLEFIVPESEAFQSVIVHRQHGSGWVFTDGDAVNPQEIAIQLQQMNAVYANANKQSLVEAINAMLTLGWSDDELEERGMEILRNSGRGGEPIYIPMWKGVGITNKLEIVWMYLQLALGTIVAATVIVMILNYFVLSAGREEQAF